MRKLFILIFCFVAILFCNLGKSHATPVMGQFTGTFYSWDGPDDLLDKINMGSRFFGVFTLDAIKEHEDPGWAVYTSSDGELSLTIFGKNEVFFFNSPLRHILINDNYYNGDIFSLFSGSFNAPLTDDYFVIETSFELSDSTCTIFNDTSFPTTLNLEDFDNDFFGLYSFKIVADFFYKLHGSIDTFSMRPVPEPINIDIKPGTDLNPINPKGKGRIPVAILSTEEFYAPDMVDRNSLTFGRRGEETSFAFCSGTPEDVNGDGFEDLVCYFNTQQAGFGGGDTEGILKGERTDGWPIGWPIEGRDSVNIMIYK